MRNTNIILEKFAYVNDQLNKVFLGEKKPLDIFLVVSSAFKRDKHYREVADDVNFNPYKE